MAGAQEMSRPQVRHLDTTLRFLQPQQWHHHAVGWASPDVPGRLPWRLPWRLPPDRLPARLPPRSALVDAAADIVFDRLASSVVGKLLGLAVTAVRVHQPQLTLVDFR